MRIQVAGEMASYPQMCANPACESLAAGIASLHCLNFENYFWRCHSCGLSDLRRAVEMPRPHLVPKGVIFPYPLATSAFYTVPIHQALERSEYQRSLVLERSLRPMVSRDWPTLQPSVQHEMGRQVETYLRARIGSPINFADYLATRCVKIPTIVEGGDLLRDVFAHVPEHGTVELVLEVQTHIKYERHQATATINLYSIIES